MLRLKSILIPIVAVLTLAFAAAPVFASTSDDLSAADRGLANVMETLVSDMSRAENVSDLDQPITNFRTSAKYVKDEFARITREAKSDGWRQIAGKMAQAVDDMLSATADLQSAITAQDQTAYVAASNKFNTAVNDYEQAAKDANEYAINHPLDGGNTGWALWVVMLAVSVVCLVGALVANFLTRNQHGVIKEKDGKTFSLKQVRRNILIGAAVFVLGAAIPTAQYYYGMYHADAYGRFTYTIFWYPLVIGVVLFVLSAVQYVMSFFKLKQAGGLAHADNATEMAQVSAGVAVPTIGSKNPNKK